MKAQKHVFMYFLHLVPTYIPPYIIMVKAPFHSVNMTARPGLSEVPWHKATVNEGDCLYLPYEWLHQVEFGWPARQVVCCVCVMTLSLSVLQVRSHNRNFGVNVWWIPFEYV